MTTTARRNQQRRLAKRAAVALSLASVVPGALPAPARAQQQGGTLPPPPPITRRVREVLVRGVQPAALPDDPTGFTAVIRVDEHRDEVTSVPDLLERVPGVQIRRFGGEGQPAEISIRGSTASQVVVLLDGVRLNTAQSGRVDLSTIPLDLLERIEVSRGGGSVQAGSDAIGGVVRLVTRQPGGPRRTDAAVGGGSFETVQGSFVTSGGTPVVDYALGYAGFGTEGDFEFRRPTVEIGDIRIEPDPETAERINGDVEQHSTLFALGRDFGERVRLSVRDQLYYGSRGEPGLDSGSAGEAGQRPNARERRTRNVLGATLEAARVGPLAIDAAAELWHRFERTRFRDPDVVPSLGRSIDTSDRNHELGSRLRLERSASLGPSEHRASLVLEGRRDLLRSDQFDAEGRNAIGVVAQDDAALLGDRVRLVPALRFDKTEGFDGQWLPRVGAIAAPFPWLRLQANAERSFRVPNFDELYSPDRGFLRGNPDLEPEEAWNFDVGGALGAARLGPFEDLRLEGAFFHNDVRESIVFLLVSPSLVEPRNTGAATIRGYELSAGLRALGWLGLEASHTHLDAEVDRTGAPLAGRADDETRLRVEIGPSSRAIVLSGDVAWTSEIPVSESGNTVLPDRTVFDAALSVDLARVAAVASRLPMDSLRVTFEGRNLGDVSVRDLQFFPQPGRTLALRVDTSW